MNTPQESGPPRFEVATLARYTVPIHLALPWILWGLALVDDQAPVGLFVFLHVAFPVALVVSYRWWRGQGIDVVLLIMVNHAATFVSGGLAAWLASAL